MSVDIREMKQRLRGEAKRRRAVAAAAAPGAGAALRDALLALIDQGRAALAPGAAVSAFWPKGDECDTRPAMMALAGRGHPIGLPVVVAPAKPLVFRRWAPDDRLVPASFGVMEPAPEQAEVVPAFMLVPLLAFDRRGMRLGYGGGFYDRTLAALAERGRAPLAVGVAYAGQELPAVPADATDRALDWIVTERETIETGGTGGAAAVLR